VLRRFVLAGRDRHHRGKVAQEEAIVAVDHDAQELAALAEHKVTRRRREIPKHPLEKAVVHTHIPAMVGVEFEPEFAVSLPPLLMRTASGNLKGSVARGYTLTPSAETCWASTGITTTRGSASRNSIVEPLVR